MASLADEDAEAVRKWLDQHQFEHVSSRGTAAARFGDSQEVWERDGTLVRLTRDRAGQWSWDLSRTGASAWLDVDRVAAAMGSSSTARVELMAELAATLNDRVFAALSNTVPHSP